MKIDALGLTEHFLITVETDGMYDAAPYHVDDPVIDAKLKKVLSGGVDVNGIPMSNDGIATPYGIIERLRGLGYSVEYKGLREPEPRIDILHPLKEVDSYS